MEEKMLLNEEKIRENLSRAEFSNIKIHTFREIDSTNNVAKEEGKKDRGEYEVFISERQSHGRGRLGRTFSSPVGGLYMSFLIPVKDFKFNPVSLTTYTAVVVCRALESEIAIQPKIKWVNDIYVGGKKLSGILTEGVIDSNSTKIAYAVSGIGINLTRGVLPEQLSKTATSIEEQTSEKADINRISAAIIKEFIKGISTVGTLEIAEEYRKRCFVIGKDVDVIKVLKKYSAKVLGITDKCELILELSDGKREILSTGEVSLRVKE